MIVDLDGKLMEAAEARVSPFDGAYQYGDGIFDTLRCYRGYPYQLEEHLLRLSREAELLQLPFELDIEHWAGRLQLVLESNDLIEKDARVRIQISRGGGPDDDLIASDPSRLKAVSFIVARPVSDLLMPQQMDGVRAMTLQSNFARGNFPQIKSLNYLPSVMAARFARAAGFDEAILLNQQSRVLEGASSNVFLVKEGELRTPPPRLGLLPGITRDRILLLAAKLGIPAVESAFELRELLIADEAFLTGSVKEIVPLIEVDKATISEGRPGSLTRTLQEAYQSDVELQAGR